MLKFVPITPEYGEHYMQFYAASEEKSADYTFAISGVGKTNTAMKWHSPTTYAGCAIMKTAVPYIIRRLAAGNAPIGNKFCAGIFLGAFLLRGFRECWPAFCPVFLKIPFV